MSLVQKSGAGSDIVGAVPYLIPPFPDDFLERHPDMKDWMDEANRRMQEFCMVLKIRLQDAGVDQGANGAEYNQTKNPELTVKSSSRRAASGARWIEKHTFKL